MNEANSDLGTNVHIHPLLESLANLEKACRDAVDCLNVLAYCSSGPEFCRLEKLQRLYGGDGCSGHRQTIHQVIGVVGHCLRPESEVRSYRIDVIKADWTDDDVEVHVTDEPYIEGSKTHEIQAENAAAALLTLIDQSKRSLLDAIASATGGNLEVVMSEIYGEPLIDNAWQRLSDHWGSVMAKVRIPSGLDLTGLRDVISEEIKAAKHLLTFGSMTPNVNATRPESGTSVASTGTRKSSTKRKKNTTPDGEAPSYSLIVAELCRHHRLESPDGPNLTPVKQADLVKALELGKATVSDFFRHHCDGFANYKRWCGDAVALEGKLARLSLPKGTREKLRNLGGRAASIPSQEPDEVNE